MSAAGRSSRSDMYRLWSDLEQKSSATALRQLPALLTDGASPLEIARRTKTPLPSVNEILADLYGYGVVETQSTGSSLPEASRVYYLTSDGIQFFREVLGGRTSDW